MAAPLDDKLLDTNQIVILVVEDDPSARDVVSQSLSALGYRIQQAADGLEAQKCCAEKLPDLIVSDIMMPNLDGKEFLRWLRGKYQPPLFIPVLMLTAKGEVENKVEGFALGADDYLVKPFHYKELQARVQALLRIKSLTINLLRRSEELEKLNRQLKEAQSALLIKERELVTMQLAGTAAHNLGQPVTALLLHCRMLEKQIAKLRAAGKEEFACELEQTAAAIGEEASRVQKILSDFVKADPSKAVQYLGDLKILDID